MDYREGIEKMKEEEERPNFIEEYYSEDNRVFISCPHSYRHKREGKVKSEQGEVHTAIIAKEIAKHINEKNKKNLVYIIYKTNNEDDDPNYSEESEYREYVINRLKNKSGIFIDLHTMSNKRKQDIELGTNNYNNIKQDKELLTRIKNIFMQRGMEVTNDQIFFASDENNVSKNVAKSCEKIKSIQIEMNWRNYIEEEKYKNLIKSLIELIEGEMKE